MAYNNRFRHRRPSSGNKHKETDVILVKWYEDVFYVALWPRTKPITREDLAQALCDQDEPFETEEAARSVADAELKKLAEGAVIREIDMEDYPAAEPEFVTSALEADVGIVFVKKNQ